MKMILERIDEHGERVARSCHNSIYAVLKATVTHTNKCNVMGFKFSAVCQLMTGEDPKPYIDILHHWLNVYHYRKNWLMFEAVREIGVAVAFHEVPKRAEIMVTEFGTGDYRITWVSYNSHGERSQTNNWPMVPFKELSQKLREARKELRDCGYGEQIAAVAYGGDKPYPYVRDFTFLSTRDYAPASAAARLVITSQLRLVP